MISSLCSAYYCAQSQEPFRLHPIGEEGEGAFRGALVAEHAAHWVPILRGFPLFTEAQPTHIPITKETLAALEARLFGDLESYAQALSLTPRPPGNDAYAAFRPFNESTRSIYALLPLIRAHLKPGEIILDLWCRTGWTGPLLAALFPENPVLSMWEGDRGVMGYRAFAHWLGEGDRLPNLEICFRDPASPLPLKDDSVGLLVGLDTLHRYPWHSLVPEALRVTGPRGIALFPHIHLTNSEPTPYFERGGFMIHGKDWQAIFDGCLRGDSRRCFVLGERSLFAGSGPKELVTQPDTTDYNGVILIAPPEFEGAPLSRDKAPLALSLEDRLITNPLLTIDPHFETCLASEDGLGGHAREMLDRHPVYEERLKALMPWSLNTLDCQVLYWGARGLSVGEISGRLALPPQEVLGRVQALSDAEVVLTLPVSASCAALQRSYAEAYAPVPRQSHSLGQLWARAVRLFPDRPYLWVHGEGSAFSYEESDEIIQAVAGRLRALGLGPGDSIAVWSGMHPESIFLFWGAALAGASVAYLDPESPTAIAESILARLQPRLLFVEAKLLERAPSSLGLEVICLDPLEDDDPEPAQGTRFVSEWLDELEGQEETEEAAHLGEPEREGAILFTSGTTGVPKGVRLSQGALYRSALSLVQRYGWGREDRVLSTGALHTMSGLRNPVLGTAMVGASAIIAPLSGPAAALAMVEAARGEKATILSTAPAPLKRLRSLGDRLGPRPFSHLRQVLSTAAPLSVDLRAWVEGSLKVPIRNYYGLTETCGLCLGEALEMPEGAPASVGQPVGAIVQVVDEAGSILPPGEVGLLRVYSENLMMGYLGGDGESLIRGGWLYTGDVATMDSAHRVTLVGRRREVIKGPDGQVRHPKVLEAFVAGLPGLGGAQVVKVLDAQGDERMVLAVVSQGQGEGPGGISEVEILRAIRQGLGVGWTPARVYILPELPAPGVLKGLFDAG